MTLLEIQPDATAGKDCLLDKNAPTTNTPTGASFGLISTGATTAAVYILSLDLTALSANDVLHNAWIEFTENTPNATPRSIFVYEMLAANQNWTETGATWNTKDGTNAWAGGANGCTVIGTDIGAVPIGTLMYAGNAVGAPTGLVYPIALDKARVKAAFGGLLHLVVWRGSGTSSSASPSFRTSDTSTAIARPKLSLNYTSYATLTAGKTVRIVDGFAVGGITGVDSGSGPITAPYLTPKYGMNHVLRGEELWIREGYYATTLSTDTNPDFDTLAPPSGTTRLTVRAFPGEKVVLEGLWEIKNASYVDFGEGIEFKYPANAYPTGEATFLQHVKIRGGIGWRMSKFSIQGSIAHAALELDLSPSGTGSLPPDQFVIEDFQIANVYKRALSTNNQDHGIYCGVRPPNRGIIRRGSVRNTTNGHGIKVGHDTQDTGQVDISYCSLFDNDTSATDAQNVHFSKESLGSTVQWMIMQQPSTGNHNVEEPIVGTTLGVTYGNNVVSNCIGYTSVGVVNPIQGVSDGGGNQAIDPQFVDRNNGNFTTQNAAVRLYGMFAPRARVALAATRGAASRTAATGRVAASGRNATG